MTKALKMAAIGITLVVAGAAHALSRSEAKQVQSVINQAGEDCPQVTAIRALGLVKGTGEALLAIACSNGSSYVLGMTGESAPYKIKYHFPCYMVASKLKCFP